MNSDDETSIPTGLDHEGRKRASSILCIVTATINNNAQVLKLNLDMTTAHWKLLLCKGSGWIKYGCLVMYFLPFDRIILDNEKSITNGLHREGKEPPRYYALISLLLGLDFELHYNVHILENMMISYLKDTWL